MKIAKILLAVLCLLTAAVSAAAEPSLKTREIPMNAPWGPATTTVTLPVADHPRVFFNKAGSQQLAQRAQRLPWAAKQLKHIISDADSALSAPVEIPAKAGEWSHHYVCKTCGIRLEEKDGHNICPRCGKEYSGWPYDGVVAARKHHQNIDNAETLGLAYQLTGNEKYAARAREILVGYADRYKQWPIHDYRGGQDKRGARLFAQTLDESVRMIPFAWAYDMVATSPAFSPADRQHIENDLFREAALVIRRNDFGISNWQTWHNAAIAVIGLALHDEAMVNYSINGQSGVRFQLSHSILPDGFWYEGTASYHFYALAAMQWQVLALRNAGIHIDSDPTYRSMYEAPRDYMFPNGTWPAVNDSDPVSVASQADIFEVGYGLYNEPGLGVLAAEGKRDSLMAFLWGADTLPEGHRALPASRNFEGLGATMLRQNQPNNPVAVHFDYGPHGGAHGHQDKLAIILFDHGTDVIPDPGRLAYGAPLHTQWYKTSLAHNTVIVDGKSQLSTEGELVNSDFTGAVQFATARCNTAYKDVDLTRSLALAPAYLLDVVTGQSSVDHTWDLAWHVTGTAETKLPLAPGKLPQNADGYQILKNIRLGNSTGPEHPAEFTFSGKKTSRVSLQLDQLTPRQFILANGLTGSNVTTCPAVLSRQQGNKAQWITVVATTDAPVAWQVRPEGDSILILVKAGEATQAYRLRNGALSPVAIK